MVLFVGDWLVLVKLPKNLVRPISIFLDFPEVRLLCLVGRQVLRHQGLHSPTILAAVGGSTSQQLNAL